jgi:hypothetical protein
MTANESVFAMAGYFMFRHACTPVFVTQSGREVDFYFIVVP